MTIGSSTASTARPSGVWFALLARVARRAPRGTITAVLPDGTCHRFEGPDPGPQATLVIHSPRLLWRLWTSGDLGFARAYLDGDCDSPDMEALLAWALANEDSLASTLDTGPGARLAALFHRLRPNTRPGSRRNIERHYDLGNRFYGAWLDPSMAYSAAWFDGDRSISLESAQYAKFARIAEMAGLRPEHRVLEIGCGWGGFALWAARTIGCHVTAITISRAQFDHAQDQVAATGLADRISVELVDYRDVGGRFDRIVSIEMMEAVGERYWPSYAATLRDRLQAGGRAVLQVITIDEARFAFYRERADFIQTYIFPGGMLPSPERVRDVMVRNGLQPAEEVGFGADYAETLRRWRSAFENAWPAVRELGFDERFRRMWRYYLDYCAIGFDYGRIDVRLFALDRP